MVVYDVLTLLLWYANTLVSCMIQGVIQDTIEKSITQSDIEVPPARKASHSVHIPNLLKPGLHLLFSVVRASCSLTAFKHPLGVPILPSLLSLESD